MKRIIVLIAALSLACMNISYAQKAPAKSDEGMWLPINLSKINADDMKAKGLELGVEEVYSEDKPSVKDAIVQLGGFCTGEMISPEGLMLTNHHCAYDAIASQSTTDQDYLTKGFWAMSRGEELPIPGLTASFLVRSEDVTDQILSKGSNMIALQSAIANIEEAASEGGKYKAEIESMFHGSEYYLMVYEVFRDIRLVGAPPSSIGKYGGDTDNWMWPRHTGDFALFRVYSGDDNRPADYGEGNRPYKPKHFLPISIAGVEKDDYAMIMGYPGSTTRYLTSSAIDLALSQTNGERSMLMGKKLKIMKKYMDGDDNIRLALASNYASTSNYYKYLIGQTTMLKKYDVVGVKKKNEAAFNSWVSSDPQREKKYGSILKEIDGLHEGFKETDQFMSYLNFSTFAPKVNLIARNMHRVREILDQKSDDKDAMAEAAKGLKDQIGGSFENYYTDMDKEIFYVTLLAFFENVPAKMHPPYFEEIRNSKKAKKGKNLAEKLQLWTDYAYETSLASDKTRAMEFLDNPNLKVIQKDPLVNMIASVMDHFRSKVFMDYQNFEGQIDGLRQAYVQGMREMHPDKNFYPDANFTMRATYGKVKPYYPKDGVYYDFLTTLDGVMEKEDADNPEFKVETKLKELYNNKDYGKYGMGDKMPVCFLTTNDITGGNSGSPVVNGKGELIGCAFDGNWEAMASDIFVFPDVTRTIVVDSRYILFIIDKFANADHLLDEMKIVEKPR